MFVWKQYMKRNIRGEITKVYRSLWLFGFIPLFIYIDGK